MPRPAGVSIPLSAIKRVEIRPRQAGLPGFNTIKCD